jgi:hypothetical protein
MPPSRTFCTVEHPEGKFAATVDWDPLAPSALSRTLIIPSGTAISELSLSCYAEAIRPTVTPDRNFAWRFGSSNGGRGLMPLVDAMDHPGMRFFETDGEDGVITVKPSTFSATGLAQRLADGVREQSLQLGQMRAFGPVQEDVINELFLSLSEVVIEKAEERGMKVLEQRLLSQVCSPTLGFTRTCEVLRKVRLQDLAQSGRMLELALVQDVVALATKALPGSIPMRKQLETALLAAIDLVAGRAERARGAGVALVLDLLAAMESQLNLSLNPSETDELTTVLSIVVECQKSGACTISEIRKRLEKPQAYYAAGAATARAAVKWEQAERFILTALRVLKPSQDTTEAEQLQSALGLALDLVDWACKSSQGAAVCTGALDMKNVRELVDGILERDLGRTAVAGFALISTTSVNQDEELRRVSRLASTLGAFLTSSTTAREPTEDERQARRDARKKALSSLIDEYGSRKNRRGDWVFSVGSDVMTNPGFALLVKQPETPTTFHWTPISLNLGLAADYHSASGWGFHADVSPIDLGGYLAIRPNNHSCPSGAQTDEETGGCARETTGNTTDTNNSGGAVAVAPADIVRPTTTIGLTYLFPSVDLVVLLGGTLGYSPKLGASDEDEAARQQSFNGGVALGMYIPIFDFN